MSQYQRIFLIVDPSLKRTPAFERAIALAHATGARLHLGLFDYREAIAALGLFDAQSMARARDGYIAQCRQWLESEAVNLRANGLTVTTEAVWAHPIHREIVAQVVEFAADLVIKDVQHESLLKRVLLTPLDWQLLRECPAPLLLVHGVAHVMPRRVIAAVDPLRDEVSGFNDRIIRAALSLSIQCDAELHLVHAVDPIPLILATDPVPEPVISADLYVALLQSHREAFERLADAHGVPKERRHLLTGEAATAIAEFAAHDATDVIVMGTIQRRGVDRLVMGSTAERILGPMPCSVLAVKPDEPLAAVRLPSRSEAVA